MTLSEPQFKTEQFKTKLRRMPYEDTSRLSNWTGDREGEYHVVRDVMGRHLVMATVQTATGPKPLPFYQSSGYNPKPGVRAGDWLPVLGIGEHGWINKTSDAGRHYNSPEIAQTARQLAENWTGGADLPVPSWSERTDQHVNDIMKQHWGVTAARDVDDPVIHQNIHAVLSGIRGRTSAKNARDFRGAT
jgi:hypothetical protein